jgi:serine/threonine-protein kinase
MKFGQYELLEQIAVGGMAEVFKGRVVAAEGFEKLVAIKRILPDLAEDERFVKMLLTEARIHSALSHRNIVQIHDLGISEDGEYFIVLEYVEGYDLRVIMEQIHGAGEIIPEALSLHIAAEIAQGLNFAHDLRGPDGLALGLVHRDVTPSNILISFAGEVKLSDFGLAKRRHDRSVVGSLKGNLAYMSPEQAKQAELDRRTDIFSLGAILFELLTGKRLREITNEVAGWNQVASGVLPSARQVRPDLPAGVEHLLDGALAVDPEKRFPDAATFGAAIRDVLGDLSVAVGASDLAALLGVITPPRRARTLNIERSKVIRLGPEAQALKEAIAAPATPAPVLLPGRPVNKTLRLADPGATPPPARRLTPARTPARQPTPLLNPARSVTPARTAARTVTPARTPVVPARPPAPAPAPVSARPAARPAPDPMVTPPPTPTPNTPLPPGRARGYTPLKTVDPDLTPAATPRPEPVPPRRTPPQPHSVSTRSTTMLGRPGANPSQPGARDWPLPGTSQATMRGPAPTRNPANAAPAAAAGAPRSTPIRTRPSSPQDPAVPATPAYGVQRPPPQQFAVARTLVAPPSNAAPAPMANVPFPDRLHHETARVQIRSERQWGGVFALLLLLVAAAGVGVHFLLIPLDVLIAWREPTGLAIATDPAGATVRVDGVPLASTAPLTISVSRDRADHVVEATHPGYKPSRQTIRYDKAASLSVRLNLERDPNAAPPDDAAPSRP